MIDYPNVPFLLFLAFYPTIFSPRSKFNFQKKTFITSGAYDRMVFWPNGVFSFDADKNGSHSYRDLLYRRLTVLDLQKSA